MHVCIYIYVIYIYIIYYIHTHIYIYIYTLETMFYLLSSKQTPSQDLCCETLQKLRNHSGKAGEAEERGCDLFVFGASPHCKALRCLRGPSGGGSGDSGLTILIQCQYSAYYIIHWCRLSGQRSSRILSLSLSLSFCILLPLQYSNMTLHNSSFTSMILLMFHDVPLQMLVFTVGYRSSPPLRNSTGRGLAVFNSFHTELWRGRWVWWCSTARVAP